MDATGFLDEINRALAGVQHDQPIAGKYRSFIGVIARTFGLAAGEVYVAYISKPGNLTVRLGQSDGAKSATLLIGLVEADQGALTVGPAERFVQRAGQATILLLRRSAPQSDWVPAYGICLVRDTHELRIMEDLRASLPDFRLIEIADRDAPSVLQRRAERDLLEQIQSAGIDPSELARALSVRDDIGEVISALTETSSGMTAAEMAVVGTRRRLVSELQELAATPGATETQMQEKLGNHYWLFGARYSRVAPRRDLAHLDQHDIPLVCADGSLQIVELKGPDIPKLVVRHRNHWIVGQPVHEAVSQCVNYLRALDEQGPILEALYRNEFGINYDFRRVRGTVIIGHQSLVRDGEADRRQIDQAIRSYNAHLARVEVLTYADLLDNAERALNFETELAEGALSGS
ncbi:Shedu anti-phage system protein SduA domain-containing protein [Actinomadura rudentiformis]|uniref:Shedu anti-phage system protein SduA domain-containing protein n=1 Tax=Actinomadura rudentiformis TaxID=359158 RepID=UPI00178C3072|nr:Shedu anti-phage system protein SduA domain-containing protein [Actinomadura rudentiformis]